MKTKSTLFLSALALTASALLATAQDASNNSNGTPPPAEGRGGGGGGRGDRRGNFEEFRHRMEERLKTSLKATDEEWAVLQPLLEKVQAKQREAMGARFGGMFPGGRRGGREGGPNPGGGAGGPPPAGEASSSRGWRGGGGGSPESQALRTTLENESASADDIKAKLTAVRDQRKKAEGELTQARADLQKVLTLRQEATLVSMGILE